MVEDAVFSHFDGDGFFHYGEGPAEAATFVGAIEGYQVQPFDHTQELFGFGEGGDIEFAHRREVEPPQSVATMMKSDAIGKAGGQRFNLKYVGQKFNQLVNLVPNGVGTRLVVLIMQVFFDM